MTTEPENIGLGGHEPLPDQIIRDDSSLPIEEQLAAVREELEESRREENQSVEAAHRAQADLVNYRRRADEERATLSKYANSRLIAKLLPVMEELDLAVSHAGDGGTNLSWLDGVKLIQRKLSNLLQSEGVTEIAAVGIMFNPVEHEALGTEQTTKHPSGYVTQAVRPGYRLHDRVIQPAQVMVAVEPEKTGIENDPQESKEISDG